MSVDVERRLARWRVTSDARDLWPHTTPAQFDAAVAEIVQVTRAVLANPTGACSFTLEDTSPLATFGVAAFALGLGPLLGYWSEVGRLRTSPAVAALLGEHLAHGRRRAALLEGELHRVGARLARESVATVALKASHTGRVYFPEPGTRPASDIDLLVSPRDYDRAALVLSELGYCRGAVVASPPRSEWTPRNAPTVPKSLELSHAEDALAVDLHASLDRNLASGATAGLGPVEPATCPLLGQDGVPVRVLPEPLLLAYLAFHTAWHLGRTPLVRVLELVLVIRRDFAGDGAAWDRMTALAETSGTARFLFPALELAERLSPGSVPAEVRGRLRGVVPLLTRWATRRLGPEAVQQPYRRSVDVYLLAAGSLFELIYLFFRPVGREVPDPWHQWARRQLYRLWQLARGRFALHFWR